MGRKRVRKNYYKNSGAQRRAGFITTALVALKIVLLVAGFAALSLFLILAYDAVTQSSYFEARTITLEGNNQLTREAILEQAGLKLHDNLLSVNVSALRARILAHPWVASAEVERALPDAVHIRIKEHVPIAVIKLDKLCYIDEDGQIFEADVCEEKTDLPLVTGFESDTEVLAHPRRSEIFSAVMELLRLTRSRKNAVPFDTLKRIHADKEMGLTIDALFSGFTPPVNAEYVVPLCAAETGQPSIEEQPSLVTIKIGLGGYALKYDRLQYVVSHLKKEPGPIQYIDLTDLDRVVVKPSQPEPAPKSSVAHHGNTRRAPGKEV